MSQTKYVWHIMDLKDGKTCSKCCHFGDVALCRMHPCGPHERADWQTGYYTEERDVRASDA